MIDIGSAAIGRGTSTSSEWTTIDKNNPANETGKITSIEIWAENNLVNCEVATFYEGEPNVLSTRDTHTIGSVTAGSKQTFEVSLNVVAGDYIGIYFTAGKLEADTFGDGMWQVHLDNIPCTNIEFIPYANISLSLYGTGALGVSIGGSFGFSGSLDKLTKKALLGAFGFSGVVSSSQIFKKALSGVLTFTKASLTAIIPWNYQKITKAIATYTKTGKDISAYTKTDKDISDYTKRGENKC